MLFMPNIHMEECFVVVVVVLHYDVFTYGTFVKLLEFSHARNQSCILFELYAFF